MMVMAFWQSNQSVAGSGQTEGTLVCCHCCPNDSSGENHLQGVLWHLLYVMYWATPPGFAIAQSYLIKGIKWDGFPWHHIVSIICSVGEMGWAPIDRGVNGEGREVSWHIRTLMIQISKSSPKVVLFKAITLYKVDEIKKLFPPGTTFSPHLCGVFSNPESSVINIGSVLRLYFEVCFCDQKHTV